MDRLSRLRDWVAGPRVPTGRAELAWMGASGAGIFLLAQLDSPGTLVEVALLAPALAAFVLRALVPRLYAEAFAFAVIAPIGLVVGQDGHLEGMFFATTLVTLYTAWHLGVSVRSAVMLAAAATTPWIVSQVLGGSDAIGWMAWSSATLFTFGLGMGLRTQERVIAELEEAREALALQAVAEERRRIARDLHDLAGHTLAAVLLHVTGARHVLRRDINEVERALLDAEAVGRASLDQIRATVAALRTDERGTDPSLAGSADLAGLVEEYQRAGLRIDLRIATDAADLTGPVGTALHRIARESLANVARHAPDNAVEVVLAGGGGGVNLSISDRGRPAAQPERGTGHFGLIGMQERARALGGELSAGPTADGWEVTAVLPVAVSSPEAVLPT
ncbi:MAG: sensor histidine kinase [Microthrixaceae bacterium]